MKVVVAEKPSVAKDIAKVIGADTRCDGYLEGNGYKVTWCIGHLVELQEAQAYNEKFAKWDIDDLPILPYKFQYKVTPDKQKQFNVIKSLINASDTDELIEATDAGREGELIFRLVYHQALCSKPVKRLWLNSMTDQAIKEAFESLKPWTEYDNLYQAALSRQQADWLLGINLSRLYSCKYNTGLACGRVQTPTLQLIVRREIEISKFVPVPYYVIEADLGDFIAKCQVDDKALADKIVSLCNLKTATVTSVEKSNKKTKAPLLFDLTTLQKEANTLFGYTAKDTLSYAQELYEKKLITYPRTDSRYITSDLRDPVIALINAFKTNGVLEGIDASAFDHMNVDRLVNNAKVSDHHALLPTENLSKAELEKLPETLKNICTLIVYRLVIAAAREYQYVATKVLLDINSYEFTANGQKVTDYGFKTFEKQMRKVLGKTVSDPDNQELPELNKGDTRLVKEIKSNEKFTTPPSRYTEASILDAMETCGKMIEDEELKDIMSACKGLGTPATRDGIIESLIKSKYIIRKGKNLLPTPKGVAFIGVVTDKVKQPELTANWEYQLSQIQKGQETSNDFLHDLTRFIQDYTEEVKALPLAEAGNLFTAAQAIAKCPKCGGNVLDGKFGPYCVSKCGMALGRARGQKLKPDQVAKLCEGKKVLMKGLTSKNGNKYDCYFVPNGIKPYEYEKDGKKYSGYEFNIELDWPEKKKKKE